MNRLREHLSPFVLSDVTATGTRIGVGAYGTVEEVRIPGAVCAAKRICDVRTVGELEEAAVHKVVEEYRLLSTLRHPHILQFLGVCFFPGERLPALVMERLSTSLDDILQNPSTDTKPHIPMNLKCSILHDVANGLTYLHRHSPPITHGNLSTRNVLLDSAMVAKITDGCVARIVNHLTPAATVINNALVYMPPEALVPAVCNHTLHSSADIFCLGVVSMFTLTQTVQTSPSSLLEPTYTDKESGTLQARTELERRIEYMQAIYAQFPQGHPLIELIQRCLNNLPALRPNISDVLLLIEQARAACEGHPEDSMTRLELIQSLQSQQSNEVKELRQQLESCRIENQALTQQLKGKETELASALQSLHQQSPKDTGRSQEAVSTLPPPARPTGTRGSWQPNSTPANTGKTSENTLKVQCYTQKPAEHKFLSRGSATIDGNFAYFTPSNRSSVLMYNVINGKWTELPECPCSNAALVCVDGALVAVGGESNSTVSNKLFTLYGNRWLEEYPPMNTARLQCSVVSVTTSRPQTHLFVIGGKHGHSEVDWTSSVDFLNTSKKCWYKLASLPQPPLEPCATVCGGKLHVISKTGEGYTCSLKTPAADMVWLSLPSLPVTDTTAATLRRQLVVVGGRAGGTAVGSILQLVGEQWAEIGRTLTPRQECLVVCPSPEKVIIVGGVGSWDSVELCNAE